MKLSIQAEENAEMLRQLRENISTMTRKVRILLIEDMANDRYLLSVLLRDLFQDCEIVEARNRDEAVSELAQRDVDVIFLDLSLPVISGVELMHQLSDSERKKLVVVTGLNSESQEVMAALKLGAVKVVLKPVTEEDLRAIFGRNV